MSFSYGKTPGQGDGFLRQFDYGSTLNFPRHIQLLLDVKLRRCGDWGWKGTAWHWATDQRFRILSSQWFPFHAVLETDGAVDLDCFMVSKERTMLKCGLTQEWLDANEPGKGGDDQILLFG